MSPPSLPLHPHTHTHYIHTQSGRSDDDKDNFYADLRPLVAVIPTSEIIILLADWNGHVGKSRAGYEGVHGGHGEEIAKQHYLLVCDFCADITHPC